MKVLVTGATGFIGSRLALRCRREDMQVVALGRNRGPQEQDRVRELESAGAAVREVLIEDLEGLVGAMQGVEVVFHLAAAQHEANEPDEYFRRINVDGTRNVFEAAAEARVGRVVHASTIGVYAWRAGAPAGNDAPLEPDNIYGATKLEGEGVVRSFEGRVPFAIARISEAYGPGDGRLLKLFQGVEKGLNLQIGPGRNLHHLVYVDDLLDGLLLAARADGALGRSFVLAGPEAVTTRAMLEAVSRAMGRKPRILRVPLWPLMLVATLLETLLRPLGVQPPLHRRRMDFFRKSFAFSLEDAKRFGYDPRVGLEAGMQETARWYAERGWIPAPRA